MEEVDGLGQRVIALGNSLGRRQQTEELVDGLGSVGHEVLDQVRVLPAYLGDQSEGLGVYAPLLIRTLELGLNGCGDDGEYFGVGHESGDPCDVSSLALGEGFGVEEGVEVRQEEGSAVAAGAVAAVGVALFYVCEEVFGGLYFVLVEGGQHLLEGPLLFVHDILYKKPIILSTILKLRSTLPLLRLYSSPVI